MLRARSEHQMPKHGQPGKLELLSRDLIPLQVFSALMLPSCINPRAGFEWFSTPDKERHTLYVGRS